MSRIVAASLAAVLLFLLAGMASADVTLLAQNFDSMGPSGTAPPAGWAIGHLNPVLNRDTNAGNGSAIVTETLLVDDGNTDGGTNGYSFNYGATGAADRALGNIPRTGNGDHIIQVTVTNNTGFALSAITLTYTGEQWRRGQSAASSKPEKLQVYYSPTSSTAGFVPMGAAFDFNALQDAPGQAQIALDGNAAANRTVITGTYTPATPIPNGATFYIRWYDWNDDATMDHGLAIDDVQVQGNANTAPDSPILIEPPTGSDVAMLNVPLTVHVSDADAEPLTVKFYGRKLTTAPRQPFTIIAVPDTQNYSMSYPATFTSQIQWIVNNRQALNIAYVGHEGDIVNNSDQPAQWQNANTSISIYDTMPDLPFGLTIGNHDENPNGTASGTTEFNTYFPYTRYQDRAWYGGHYGTNNDNHYILFSAAGMDFIAIHFKYDGSGPAANVLAWAGNLLQTHSNRRAIVVTHSLLETTAAWTGQGSTIYNALKGYPNLFLMLCGHNHGEARRADVYNNHTINTLLADYQSYTNGGNGFLRILRFSPDDNQISVTTYSPTLGQYERDSGSEFTLTYDMGGGTYAEIGTLTGVPSDTNATITWQNLEPRRTYQWYATVSDGRSLVTSPAWSFAIPTPPGPELTVGPAGFDRSVWIRTPLADDTFTVTNTGLGTLDYAITEDADWLSVSPASGSSTGEADSIQILYDTSMLSAGTHTATIAVTAPGAWASPQTITVTVHVSTVRPDFDGDADVDQDDFGHLQTCLTDMGVRPAPGCENADLNNNNAVNQEDVTIFRRCMSGANNPATPTCAD